MPDEGVWYLEKRAEQLAYVHLSRRNDLLISEQASDYGVDYLVSLTRAGKNTGRMFGVEVKALKSASQARPVTPDGDEARLNIKKVFVPRDIPFPLCLLVFIMETDDGYFRWIKKPVYGGQSPPRLIVESNDKLFRKLSSMTLDDIINEVNSWYDSKMKIPA